MANRFWVGGGSSTNWSATSNTNWATSSGGSNNASVPTTTDVAIFDSNSGASGSVISASTAIQGLDCTGGTGSYTGTLTHNGSVTLTINTGAATSFRLSAGMTYTVIGGTSLVTFTNTSGTAQVTSAGHSLGALTVNGAGGTVQQQDDLAINGATSSTLTITTGIFDGNSHALTANIITCSGASTRSFLLGSGVTIGGAVTANATIWNVGGSGLTFTKNSANITVIAPTSSIFNQSFTTAANATTLNGITFNAITTGTITAITATTTFSSMAIGSGNSMTFPGNATTTISGAFTWAGTSGAPIAITSSSTSAAATISVPSGTCSLTWGMLNGITGSGGATFTATNTLAAAQNTGWAISPPLDAALSAASIATAVWTDLLAGADFSTSSSVGALVKAATNLQYTVAAIGRGTVGSSPSTTSLPTSAFTPATSGSVANQLVGRVVLFDAATSTVALRGQVATISASSASATPTLTVSTLTATPASGDTFSVI